MSGNDQAIWRAQREYDAAKMKYEHSKSTAAQKAQAKADMDAAMARIAALQAESESKSTNQFTTSSTTVSKSDPSYSSIDPTTVPASERLAEQRAEGYEVAQKVYQSPSSTPSQKAQAYNTIQYYEAKYDVPAAIVTSADIIYISGSSTISSSMIVAPSMVKTIGVNQNVGTMSSADILNMGQEAFNSLPPQVGWFVFGGFAVFALGVLIYEVATGVDDSKDKKESKRGKLTGSTGGLTDAEKEVIEDLLEQGKDVEVVPKDPNSIDKTPDFKVDGVPTELKSLENNNTNTGMKRVQEGFKQGAETVIIDGRAAGLTEKEAQEILNRAAGKYPNKQLPGSVEIWINGGTIIYP